MHQMFLNWWPSGLKKESESMKIPMTRAITVIEFPIQSILNSFIKSLSQKRNFNWDFKKGYNILLSL